MARSSNYMPGVAIFLAGVAAAALATSRRRKAIEPDTTQELKNAVSQLKARLEAQESAIDDRLNRLESTIEAHSAKLADVPSTSQIVAAMEQLLSRTMSSLDDRLTNQANAIEVLKITVSQTDGLLERVLESLDSLHGSVEPMGRVDETLLSPPVR
jgi:chromosome segregation ATPase